MKRRRLQPGDYTVGWICALPIELAAAQEMLDEVDTSPQDSFDSTPYTLGRIGDHNVVLACLPAGQMGTHSAATAATQMTSKFTSIRIGLMVGIGGGVPSADTDIRLGDVVISQPNLQHGGVVQYDFGKTGAGGHKTRTGWLNAPPAVLLNAVSNLRALHFRNRSNLATYLSAFNRLKNFSRNTAGPDVLFKATYNYIGGATCEQCNKEKVVKRTPRKGQEIVIYYGTIASGNQVMKDGVLRDRLSTELGGVMCFEMEAAGLMNAFPCLVIRGICDYADSHKNKNWQPYAAATAAACAKEILSVIHATRVATTCTVDEATMYGKLQSAIDGLNLDLFLLMLSALDQDKYISTARCLDYGHPIFHWIFRNKDFVQWNSANCSQVLWLSGPPKRSIDQVSFYIVHQEKNTALKTDHLVLYFFFSTATRENSIAADFVHTLLRQIICCSPRDKSLLIIQSFLHSLLDEAFKKDAAPNWKERGFNEGDSLGENLQKLLNAPVNEYLTALGAALNGDQRGLSIVVDGLDKVVHQRGKFIKGVRAFVEHLQQRASKVKILLTSQPLAEIKDLFDGLPCIEHDRERKECLASLRFDNTRYDKISREHRGSFEWIWTQDQYTDWSTSDASRLLYIQGKPGSGKSTLTKYFGDYLLEREPAAKSAIVAKFFYSYREGELQRSHYNMLRSILYDILDQDEAFFYHHFQTKYRDQRRREPRVAWDYESLKTVLTSLQDYLLERRLYLIIDAVDESEENDRRDVLKLLFKLCSKTIYCIAKVFVASRPVGELDLRISPSHHNFIRLQDETKRDISSFARSFLDGLNLTYVLAQATEYLVENAQGVFLWVKLVGGELETYAAEGYSEEQIFKFLQGLPTELEDFYTLMFKEMNWDNRYPTDAVKIFRFVLFGRRPLTVDELLHALVVPDDPNTQFTPPDDSFQRRIPSERRIIHCGGNFLEIKRRHGTGTTSSDSRISQTNKAAGNGTVQVMHQTVREYFLNTDGHVANSKFRMCAKDAHVCISMTCIRYLMLCAANTSLAGRAPDIKSWTSEHFEGYAQYLDNMPLANYILCYLKHHIDGCQQDANIQGITSQFIDELAHNPAVYLLESWVSSSLDAIILGEEHGPAAKQFRNKVLHAAVRKGFSTAAEVLLTVGANVNARADDGWTALQAAAGGGNAEVVDKLLAANADVNAREDDGWTALQVAAGGGHVEVVDKLLAANADVNATAAKFHGLTALQAAAGGGHVEVVDKLLAANADVNARGGGWTALQAAAGGGHVEVVDKLLAANADVNAEEEDDRWTALRAAAGGGHVEIVDKLLAANADVNAAAAMFRGLTALQAAAGGGHVEVVDKLLAANADVNAAAAKFGGLTALQAAAGGGHVKVVDKLLAANADVNAAAAKFRGLTALQTVACGGDIVSRSYGNAARFGGLMALWAAESDSDEVSWSYGDATEFRGLTALQAAAGGFHVEIVEKLKRAGAVN